MIHQVGSKNEWLLLSVTFTGKLELDLQEKEHRFFYKNLLGIIKIALRLRDQHVFMWQSVKVSKVFNTLTSKQIFLKTKIFFKNLEYTFLVDTTEIENTSFRFKTALSETNLKTNRMAPPNWTYHKEQSFTSKYFIFLETFFLF